MFDFFVYFNIFLGFVEDGGIQVELVRDGEVEWGLLIIEQVFLDGYKVLLSFLSFKLWLVVFW